MPSFLMSRATALLLAADATSDRSETDEDGAEADDAEAENLKEG